MFPGRFAAAEELLDGWMRHRPGHTNTRACDTGRGTVPAKWIVVLAVLGSGCRGESTGTPAPTGADPVAPGRDAGARAADEPISAAACTGDCEPFVIAELPIDRGIALALDGAGFGYVGPLYDDRIFRVALRPGATPEVLYRSPGKDVGAIEARGDRLRWSSNATGTIYEAPLAGGGPIGVVADGLPGVWGFASDDRTLYWTDFAGSAPGMVWKRPLNGGASVGLGKDARSRMAVNLLLDGPGGDILYSDRSPRVMRVPAGGGTPTVWIELPGRRESHGLAQDETHVYLETLSTNDVLRIDRETGRLELVAHTEKTPAAVAVDATAVYWLDYVGPAVLHGRRK